MSDLSGKPHKYRPLLDADPEILSREPHLNREVANDVVALRLMGDESNLDWWDGGGWMFFKTLRLHFQGTKAGALKVMVEALNKDEKTIRRYCERGWIPFSTRTAGGHWRIAYRKFTREIYHRMLRRLLPKMRGKTVVQGIRKRRKKLVKNLIAETWTAYSGRLMAQSLFPEEVITAEQKRKHDLQDEPLPEIWLRAVAGGSKRKALLQVAALRLRAQEAPVSPRKGVGLLAGEIGISRATLYRWYQPKEMRAALGGIAA